ncbi:MAG: ABC transporter transmembrane domain-containing protein [Anaerolineae bacterium]|nr:ATP-binding cassette domain-containing protein [Chloroflexota bacterium]
MRRLLPFLRPYLVLILVIAGLHFARANTELALPDYMSRIVNVGLQQNGIPRPVPEALRSSQLERLSLLLSEDAASTLRAAYRSVEPGSAEAAELIGRYPVLSSEPVALLNTSDPAALDGLEQILTPALAAATGLQQLQAEPERAAQAAQALGVDPALLAAGGDPWELLARLSPQQRAGLGAAVQSQLGAVDEAILRQMAIAAVHDEYLALGMDTFALQRNYIIHMGLLMLLVALAGVAAAITVGLLASRIAAGFARDVRRAVFAKVESFSSTEFDRFSTASLITRSTNDINQVQMLVGMSVRMLIYSPIMAVGGVLRALSKSTSMWWVIALAVLVVTGLVGVGFSILIPRFQIIQRKLDRLNLVMRERLTGLMVIRAFNKQRAEADRFDVANLELTQINLFVGRVFVLLFPLMGLVMSGVSLVVIWVGAHQIAQSQLQVGDMMAFMQYAMQILMSFMMMSMMFGNVPRAAVSADRIADVLDTELAITDPEYPQAFPDPLVATVEFRGVGFRYPNAEEDVLCDINFVARPGETTAFIGTTGSGKSTLVNLIPRFYDVTAGAVLVGGRDVRSVSQAELRDRIGYVPQAASLFSGTIASNLEYGLRRNRSGTPPQEALERATRIAQASGFIGARADGLEAEIAQGGTNVSGGQRQRLSIARALAKQPPILIFDDALSALDYRTDAALRRALRAETADATVIIVTQRVATIRHAEQIIVLDEGRVVGHGTHAELLHSCEAYRDIARSQLSEEELA